MRSSKARGERSTACQNEAGERVAQVRRRCIRAQGTHGATDLVERLATALHAADAQLAVAKTFDQPHPVFCLCRRDLAEHLGDFLAGGGRKIDRWYGSLKVVEVAFDDEEAAFRNINTRDELAAAAKDLPAGAA